ncbi:predicted protein [Lichtheimia corymbifera JMRC:FSU:9682]|uniref:Uncharacterized protein n=1 Tax=Lichtheimia corymbifera JMRC:FSU:9682 TaxID=1263082 RepID=A0A068RYQ3_9FUNG|nr:predicted protein [Lichtheimia corymbifera JMRC:FSU:9682]
MHVIGGSYQQPAQEAATMSNRIHTFSFNNICSTLCGFSSLANYFHQEHPAAYISYGSVTSATSYNCVCVFWCYQRLSSTQGSRHQATPLPFESGYQQSFIAWTSLQQGNRHQAFYIPYGLG